MLLVKSLNQDPLVDASSWLADFTLKEPIQQVGRILESIYELSFAAPTIRSFKTMLHWLELVVF